MRMSSRKRILATINHQGSDRVSIDPGHTKSTGIHPVPLDQLRRVYDIEKNLIRVIDVWWTLKRIERTDIIAPGGSFVFSLILNIQMPQQTMPWSCSRLCASFENTWFSMYTSQDWSNP